MFHACSLKELWHFVPFIVILLPRYCSIQEGRCALARSPKQRGSGEVDTTATADSDEMAGDDESFRARLRSLSSESLSTPSPNEACLKAPPQEQLEKLLGISLNPESYAWLRQTGKPSGPEPVAAPEKPSGPEPVPAPPSELVAAPVEAPDA